MDLLDIEDNKRSIYRVCDSHFVLTDKFKTFHNRTNLKVGAVPCVNVPGKL